MRSATTRRFAILACTLGLFACGAAPAAAATLTPNIFTDPSGPGAGNLCAPTPTAGHCSLRGAITAAHAGDTVQLAAGTYVLGQGGELLLQEGITIVGAGAGLTTIEQTQAQRVIKADSGLTMSGVTITGGEVIGEPGEPGSSVGAAGDAGENVDGGGIETTGLTTLTDVVVTGNQIYGGDGGAGQFGFAGTTKGGAGGNGGHASGAGISGGPLVLDHVTVADNLAQPGAGGAGGIGGTTTDGGAGGGGGTSAGGGVSVGSEALTATDSLIADNVAATGHGGVGGEGGSTSGTGGAGGAGEAASGGGIFANRAVALTNVTLTGNFAEGGTGGAGGAGRGSSPSAGGVGGIGFGGTGGAVALFNLSGATATFASATIDGNTALAGAAGGGGLGKAGGAAGATGVQIADQGGDVYVTSAALTLRGTIIAAGQAAAGHEDCGINSGTITSAGHNLEEHHQCIAAPQAGDLLDTPPGLASLAANGGSTETMALLPGSAAIDHGEAACVDAGGDPLTEDQRGDSRGTPCDIGAFEVQPPPSNPPSQPGTGSSNGGGSGGTPKGTTAKGPILARLKVSPAAVRDGTKASVSFHLDRGARVTFSVRRKAPGISVGKKCVAPGKSAKGKACTRLVGAGPPPRATKAAAGNDRLTWTPSGLKPGRYVLTATPAGGTPGTRSFVVQGTPRPAA